MPAPVRPPLLKMRMFHRREGQGTGVEMPGGEVA
jgi:hypothetical protein